MDSNNHDHMAVMDCKGTHENNAEIPPLTVDI